MKRDIWTLLYLLLLGCLQSVQAQDVEPSDEEGMDWVRVHHHVLDADWVAPLRMDSVATIDFINGFSLMRTTLTDGFVIPFDRSSVDSIAYATTMADDDEAKNPYHIFQLYVYTKDAAAIKSKTDYVPCYVALNGDGAYADRFVAAEIRGRGNSTWEWYDKKPYRLKLDKKHKMLGLAKAKSWVLLANYRDVTDLMNAFVFELGNWMGLPFTNHTRYVELFVNGDYMGLYQLTEQIQQGSKRVDVSDERGILITLDADDGPSLSPSAKDNFWSKVYNLPVAVKYPDDELLTTACRDSIKEVFAQLEDAIKRQDYPTASSLLDMESMVRYLMIQQLVYNVELSAPRSVYMHKDGDGPWVMGPLWDFDAGYDFDWGNMYTGHTFFTDYRETLLGADPVNHNATYRCSDFFTNLFGCKEFVKRYKDVWNQYADSLMDHTWTVMERYLASMRDGAIGRETRQWPISGKNFETEVAKMKQWLERRVAYTNELINGIPEPDEQEVVPPITNEKLCGTIDVETRMNRRTGYSQENQVVIDRNDVFSLLGIEASSFQTQSVNIVPLNTDGTVGDNNTNGVFGGWFNADGNPRLWDGGHVYIEVFSDLFNWNCGLRQDTCHDGEHTVTMQYQYQVESVLCKVNVRVHFIITDG